MKQVDSSRFGTPDALRERAAALARYEVWDREHPVELEAAAAVALVGSLYALLPVEARIREDDPEFAGVAQMRRALARLGGSDD
ncbi:MAG TPA: hypothetical protein ENK19_06150 [Acidobacteria bacterium]|nr:hypothetical protein [Acidobacteriota bacterium]